MAEATEKGEPIVLDAAFTCEEEKLAKDARDFELRKKSPQRWSQMLRKSKSSSSSSDDSVLGLVTTAVALSPLVKNPPSNDGRHGEDAVFFFSSMPTREDNNEHVPLKLLSQVVTPEVLVEVKSRLRALSDKALDEQESPATVWKLREEEKQRKTLGKAQVTAIQTGWRVRQLLAELPPSETVNTFYLKCVEKRMEKEVKALFSLAKIDKTIKVDKNFTDQNDKSAIVIAIENKDLNMLDTLLTLGVQMKNGLLHAIEEEYIEGAKVLLEHRHCNDLVIHGEDPYFRPGLTPLILCTQKNNYPMLTLLHEYGHRLEENFEASDETGTWESANELTLSLQAKTSPCYITLMAEMYNINPVTYCLKEIRQIREMELLEHEAQFYQDMLNKLETYMGYLLDEICSSEELAHFFQYDYEHQNHSIWSFLADTATSKGRNKLRNRFKLLEMASDEGLMRFVTHQQSQLAVSYLRYRSMPFLRNHAWYWRLLILALLGLTYPVLSLFYIVAPFSRIGGIITLPTISFYCHMMSEILFASILLINVQSVEKNYLGSPPSGLQMLIMIWVVGKLSQEIQECFVRGPKAYFTDSWNYADILQILLFMLDFIFTAQDLIIHRNLTEKIPRKDWHSTEPRLLAEGFQAWAYVFVFLKLLGLMREHKTLGPLQVSLGLMLTDVIRFLCIFILVMCAFAFGMSELYWYYGTKEGEAMFRSTGNETASLEDCMTTKKESFHTLLGSMVFLYWNLFGQLETNEVSLCGKHTYTETTAWALLSVYHAVAIIVLLNMLVAMMNNSYLRTSEDEDTVWKFNRAQMWIRFFRGEVIRPPPMNLIPHPWHVVNFIRGLRNKDARKRHGRRRRNALNHNMSAANFWSQLGDEKVSKGAGNPGFDSQDLGLSNDADIVITQPGASPMSKKNVIVFQRLDSDYETNEYLEDDDDTDVDSREAKCRQILKTLVNRYKLKYLLKKAKGK